jgi:energy-coupling factor transporter transmembrane protein EcfT
MSETNNTKAGMTAGIIACVLAVLGILFIGTIFVPIAFVVLIIGFAIAIKNKSIGGIGVNILALILTVIGLFTSPVLLALIYGASAVPAASQQAQQSQQSQQLESEESPGTIGTMLGSDMDFSASGVEKRNLENQIVRLQGRLKIMEQEIPRIQIKIQRAEERLASENMEKYPWQKEMVEKEIVMLNNQVSDQEAANQELRVEIKAAQSKLSAM